MTLATTTAPPAYFQEAPATVALQSQTFVALGDELLPLEGAHGMVFSGRFGSDDALSMSLLVDTTAVADDADADTDFATIIVPVPRPF